MCSGSNQVHVTMDESDNKINDRHNTSIKYRTTFNDSQDASPSIAIATALATLEETPPSATDFTLTEGVNPDALDNLVTDDAHDVSIAFTIADYLVVVQSNGTIRIGDVDE